MLAPALMSVVLTLACAVLLGLSEGQSPATECDSACQTAQGEAVRALLISTNIAIRANSSAVMTQPEHCSWQGISCCLPSGTLDLSQRFPSSVPVPCGSPYGVVSILQWLSSTSPGTMPDQSIWGGLAGSLVHLDLTGMFLQTR